MAIDACSNYIERISPDECLNSSLLKINNNFLNLESVVCDLKQRVDKVQNIRTFFYYGPNSETDVTSNMADNQTSRPSDLTIRAFVNSPSELNLPAISQLGDVAYVIYQKTGYLNNKLTDITTDYTFDKTLTDIFNSYAPVFVIWRLTYTGEDYKVDMGFPRFSQAQTSNTALNWNQPQNWLEY
jgi:hypothetical protein